MTIDINYSNSPLVSVIVPIYNVAEYLNTCVDSILNQTYSNIEVILVDDGSTDSSESIADSYAIQDKRVKVIHQENSGVGAARTAGILSCNGEYLTFIDSDDFVSPNYIYILITACQFFKCKISSLKRNIPFRHGVPLFENNIRMDDILRHISLHSEYDIQKKLLYQQIDCATTARMYATSLVKEVNREKELFPRKQCYDDLVSIYRLVHKAGPTALVDCQDIYAYRRRPTGLTGNKSNINNKIISAIRATRALDEDMSIWFPELRYAISTRCFCVLQNVYVDTLCMNTIKKRALWIEIKKYSSIVIKDKNARLRERISAYFTLFGIYIYNLYIFFHFLYKKIKGF